MIFSSIFKPWRDFWVRISPKFFGELFTCMICLPFWIGVLLGIFIYSPVIQILWIQPEWLGIFMDGCLASGSVWLVHSLQESLEKNG
jgi:hypothetical protein